MEDLLHRGLIVKESCLDIENRKQLFSYRASICFLNIDCSVYYPPPHLSLYNRSAIVSKSYFYF